MALIIDFSEELSNGTVIRELFVPCGRVKSDLDVL
jgi:hypothetical protein